MTRRDLFRGLIALPAAPVVTKLAGETTTFKRVGDLLIWTHSKGAYFTKEVSLRLSADTVQMGRTVTERVAFFWTKTVEQVSWIVRRGETVADSTVYRVLPPRGVRLPASSPRPY